MGAWRMFVLAFLLNFICGTTIAEERNSSASDYYNDYVYDETTIKNRIIDACLFPPSPSERFYLENEFSIYDTKHGMILTVVCLEPEKINKLYEKRLRKRKIQARNSFFAGARMYAEEKDYEGYELGVATFLKL